MGKEAFSKIKLLKIWEILKQDSDENNPLTTVKKVSIATAIMCWTEISTCPNFVFL